MATTANEHVEGSTVLIVDPDEARRRQLAASFAASGASVREARSAHEATEQVTQRPDLVVIDVDLPDLDGSDLATRLRSDPLTAEIPLIQRSTSPIDDGAVVRGLHRGADAYLADPVSDRVIVATAEALLRTQDLARRLEVALSSPNSGVFDWSIPTGRVRWTASLERLHGLEPGEFGGTLDAFVATVHPHDRDRVRTELERACESGHHFTISYRFLRSDGSSGHMEGQGQIFRASGGEAKRMLGLAADVSERVASRLEVEQLRRLAARLSALRDSEGVLGALAEELRGTNVDVVLAKPDDPVSAGVVFSFATLERRLDVSWSAQPGAVTRPQAIAIGELAGSAIDRALRFEAERTNAQMLQFALQPATVPHISGYQVEAMYVPAIATDRLGGDFYDVVDLDDVVVLVVGDVAGHGLIATRQMGAIRSMLRTIAVSRHGDPVDIVDEARALFDAVCDPDAPHTTVLVSRIDIETGRATVVSAGHPPPLHGNARRRPTLVGVRPGPPLGVRSSTAAAPSIVDLEPGDWLAMYTDGVFERRDVPIDDAVLNATADLTGTPSARQLLDAGDALLDESTDDRALLVVERRETA